MIQSWLLVVLSSISPQPALAGATAKVMVKIQLGEGVSLHDDEVFVAWNDSCTLKPKEKKVTLTQSGNRFQPRALVAQVGQVLAIHNADKIQHNSFSVKAIKFDSGLQKPDSINAVKLDKPGVTKVFCRIHPSMISEVLVLDNKCFVEVRASELKEGKGAPLDGGGPQAKIWLWSPSLKSFHSRKIQDGAVFTLSKSDFLTSSKPISEGPSGEVY